VEQKILLKYLNAQLNIGMFDFKKVYLLSPIAIKLIPEVYKAELVFRIKGSTKRISYSQIKKGLVSKNFYIEENLPF